MREYISPELVTALGVMARSHDAYAEAVRIDEREKVFTTLKDKADEYMCCSCGLDDIIALIKGEK